MYEGIVYFAGPQTLWGGRPADMEVLFMASSAWRWVARLRALGAWGPLDHTRCGYILKRGAVVLEHVKAADEIAPS